MNIDQTVEKLGEYYPRDTSAIMISTLKDWCKRRNIESEIDCQMFYNIVVQNHKPLAKGTFPDIVDIAEWWDNRGEYKKQSFDAIKDCFNRTEEWTVERIVKGVHYCRNIKNMNSTCEVFVKVWGELAHVDGVLKAKGFEEKRINEHLEKVKKQIVDGTYTGIKVDVKPNSITDADYTKRTNKKGEKGPGAVKIEDLI